jgi:hypothetical protein
LVDQYSSPNREKPTTIVIVMFKMELTNNLTTEREFRHCKNDPASQNCCSLRIQAFAGGAIADLSQQCYKSRVADGKSSIAKGPDEIHVDSLISLHV